MKIAPVESPAGSNLYYNAGDTTMRPPITKAVLLFSGLLLASPSAAALVFKEPQSLTQLRMAEDAASNSVHAGTSEGAADANQKWSENSGVVVPAAAVPGPESNSGAWEQAAQPARSAPAVTATPTVPPNHSSPDPVPPKVSGGHGFVLGFLGVEATALRILGGTGKAAVPLLILLQPIVAPIGLVVGLLGLFGVRL